VIVHRVMNELVKQRLEKMKEKDDRTIWVTDLIGCKRKAELRKMYPFVLPNSVILGYFAHLGFASYVSEVGGLSEVEYEKNLDGYVIRGRIDAIIDNTVVEFKTAKQVDKPFAHHVMQVRLYMWLSNMTKAVIVYVTPERFVEFKIDKPYRTEDVRELIANWSSPRFDWECKKCEFRVVCEYAKC